MHTVALTPLTIACQVSVDLLPEKLAGAEAISPLPIEKQVADAVAFILTVHVQSSMLPG